VTRNVTIDHLRRQRERPVQLDAIRSLRKTGEFWRKLEARDVLRSLQAALQGVDLEHREAFYLYEVEGRKLREVAELTESSINTVASRVRRTRERLQVLLESDRREVADA
jgi:RNA polymerase sigma factor (sigma-70 family)